MLEKLRDRLLYPTGGWYWRDEVTGKTVVARNFDALLESVKRTRASNGAELPADLAEQIEHDICRRLPDRFVKNRTKRLTEELLSRHEVDRVTDEQLREWVKLGRRLVPKELAMEHSDICQRCAKNVKLGCLSCKGIDTYLLNWIGHNRRTGYEDLLGGCYGNKVYCMVMVHLRVEDIFPIRQELPAECWYKTELEDSRWQTKTN